MRGERRELPQMRRGRVPQGGGQDGLQKKIRVDVVLAQCGVDWVLHTSEGRGTVTIQRRVRSG